MKFITLTQGMFAKVDDDMFDYLNQWKWFYGCRGYAARHITTQVCVYMHKVVCGISGKTKVDHRDRDKLNNQKYNLRICSHQQNTSNRKINANNTTGYKGVSFLRGKYQAQIAFMYKQIYLGLFDTPEKAALAYDKKAKEIFGEFASLNF